MLAKHRTLKDQQKLADQRATQEKQVWPQSDNLICILRQAVKLSVKMLVLRD